MALRGMVIGIGGLVALSLTSAGVYLVLPGHQGPPPEQIARSYFAAWSSGDLDRMKDLVADPPADFADQHRALSQALKVNAIVLEPQPLVREDHDHAHAEFTVHRTLEAGEWSYRSTLRIAKMHGRWKVAWTPGTLFPGLTAGATWRLADVPAPPTVTVDRNGKTLPGDTTARNYIPEGAGDGGSSATAIELIAPGRPQQVVKVFGQAVGGKLRTTLDTGIQAAADAAVRSAGKPAAIVAVRPSTGEVLAVADTLGGRGAFLGLYPPGSTFKVVTAAALITRGMTANAPAACPDTVVTGQRTIHNHDGLKLGDTTLGQAFAQSCNTTFAQLTVDRLSPDQVTAAAGVFGFNGHLAPGVDAYAGDCLAPRNAAEMAETAIGEGSRVQASPLAMALVAAAVEDGQWRPARLLPADRLPDVGAAHPVPQQVLDSLRPMMRSVVTGGTAAGAGLPDGVFGKTGTAEYDNAGHSHAWFIGYRGDLAFAVFVRDGESGPHVAAPLAARFLNGR